MTSLNLSTIRRTGNDPTHAILPAPRDRTAGVRRDTRAAELGAMTKIERRFWSKVSFARGARGCWLWCGAIDTSGYGSLRVDGSLTGAHRLGYSIYVEPVPAGNQVDHVHAAGCDHRHCVNFRDHLESVTQAVNVKRGRAGQRNKSKTHCPSGHEYTPENTWTDGKERQCKTCSRLKKAERRARAKADRCPN